MDVLCLKTISAPGRRCMTDIPIASTCGNLIFPSFLNSSEVLLWSSKDNQPQSLCGHPESVEALCISNEVERLLIASACSKSINVWKIYEGIVDGKHNYIQIGKNLGNVSHLTFSHDDKLIAACIYEKIWIIEIKTCTLQAAFSGHTGTVIASEFSPVDPSLLVTISEDKTYGIWSLEEKCQLYQSGIISASSSFLSLSMSPSKLFFVCGSSDGVLRIYDMTLHNSVHEIDIGNLAVKKFFTDPEDQAEARGFPILTLKYWNKSKPDDNDKSYAVSVVLNEESYIVVGCSSCFMLFNANSLDIVWLVSFSEVSPNDPNCCFSSAARIHFSVITDEDENEKLLCCALNLFSNDIHILEVDHKEKVLSQELTVLSLEPMGKDSPLKSEFQPKTIEAVKKGQKKTTKAKVDKMNQPIVFKQKIRSSGYTKDPPRKMTFQPKVNSVKKKVDGKKINNTVGPWGLKATARDIGNVYPVDSEPPSNLHKDIQLSQSMTPINDMNFSESGKTLVCAVADHSALMLKVPKTEASSHAFIGHNGPVLTAIMGHSNNLLLTTGMDQTVKIWNPTLKEHILNINTTKHNFKEENDPEKKLKENGPFVKGISGARFYFVDKFIMLTHGSQLCLYKYHIEDTKNDLKRYQTHNRYKVVQEFNVSDTQTINAFSAINSFHSYLAICACSNRKIVIFDVNKTQTVGTIEDAHKKPIHSLCQNQGSAYVSHSSEAYNLFLTAASTDGVKLWDLRVNRCVRKFEGHLNRTQKVGLAYSPCARYIAVGSEDRSIYYYDIRNSSYLSRLSGQSDVVTAVAFHPQTPMLASGTLNGKFRMYKL